MNNEVSILIPTRFDSRWTLDLNIRTIIKYTDYSPYRIIIGNAGVDKNTFDYLKSLKNIEIINCADVSRPKDELARRVKTPYFIFLHDDVQILRRGWLTERVKILEKYKSVGIVGVKGSVRYIKNWKYKQFIIRSQIKRRFFPLVMLIRNETQEDLDLMWSKVKGLDTGCIAYYQFLQQRKWKFYRYPFKNDVRHWGGMTWIVEKSLPGWTTTLNINDELEIRRRKIEKIKRIIENGLY